MKTTATIAAKSLAFTLAAALSLTACGPAGGGSSEAGAETPTNDEVITIGIIQLVEHAALDASYDGFVAALADHGYKDGEKIELLFENAQGDINNLSTISDRLVSKNADLILAIATPSVQAIAGKTTEIPILGAAVTSYPIAGLVDSDEAPGGNISGTSDMNPVAAQIDLAVELVPDAQTIGLIYNSSEDNSVLQIGIAKARVEELGLKWHEVTVTSPNDVQQAMQSLVGKCEVAYIPTDNTLASSMAAVHSIAAEAKLPTVCGESGQLQGGALATMGISYYDLGYKTGLMAVEVIGGKDPGTMPIQYADRSDEVLINGQVAEEIGFAIPEKYKDCVVQP